MKWRLLSVAVCAGFTAVVMPLVASAQEPVWGLTATGLVGEPLTDGGVRSGRAAIEPSLKWGQDGVEVRARLRWLVRQGEKRTDTDVRELSAAWRGDELTFTVGAQQVNWGRMDILRVTDVINPVDRFDLFHEELTEAKLAVWMANWEWKSGNQTLQIVATPKVPVDRLPSQLLGLPVKLSQPSASVENSTLAIRYGFDSLGWNTDVIAVRGWQSSPSLTPVRDASGVSLQAAVSRQNSVGFSADKPLGGIVLRVEGQYAHVVPGEMASAWGVGEYRQALLGAGLDVRVGPWFFAGQAIVQTDRDIGGDTARNAFASVIVQRKWLQDRLSARALHIRETQGGSSWSSLQVAYEISANQLLQLQGDLFRGEPTQVFGGFKDRSRMAASMRFRF